MKDKEIDLKVGIMSMQRIINYGSFLQSYSLKKNLEKMGADVCMVDYRVGKPLVFNNDQKIPKKASLFAKLKNKIENRLFFPRKISKKTMDRYFQAEYGIKKDFENNIMPMLGITDKMNYSPELDLLVIGSDEVFNCLQPNPAVGYSKELFGDGNNSKKLISYAASFGNTMKEGLIKHGIYDEVKEMLNKFDGVSVRDKNSLRLVEDMDCNDINKNVDPVFLYDYEEESNIEVPISDYIVVYAYSCRITREESAAIIRFAKKHNKKIICIEGFQCYLKNYVELNPFEVLAYFKKADYIITDTFHGSVFSIKYNRQFVSLVRGGTEGAYGNSAKLVDLLETFGLKDRELTNLDDMEKKLTGSIDYDRVNTRIMEERQKSIDYLKKYMG